MDNAKEKELQAIRKNLAEAIALVTDTYKNVERALSHLIDEEGYDLATVYDVLERLFEEQAAIFLAALKKIHGVGDEENRP